MNLLNFSHIIKVRNKEIKITRIEAEKLILLLTSKNIPAFVYLRGEYLVNTNFIDGIYTRDDGESVKPLDRKITEEDKIIHKEYVKKFLEGNVKYLSISNAKIKYNK